MAHNQCASFRENIPAYVLGALDVDEAAALEAHLRTCDSCPHELAAYRAIGDALLTALPPQPTPAALRKRLQARLPDGHAPRLRRPAWSWGRFALGFAIVLLVALNISSLVQIQALQRQQEQIDQRLETDRVALAILAYPNTESLPIREDGVTGRLLIDKYHNAAVLVLWNLPPLPKDQTYQAWLIDPGGDRTSAGLFNPEAGQLLTTAVLSIPQDLSNFIGLGVTIEPAGGAPLPVGPRIFKVDF